MNRYISPKNIIRKYNSSFKYIMLSLAQLHPRSIYIYFQLSLHSSLKKNYHYIIVIVFFQGVLLLLLLLLYCRYQLRERVHSIFFLQQFVIGHKVNISRNFLLHTSYPYLLFMWGPNYEAVIFYSIKMTSGHVYILILPLP